MSDRTEPNGRVIEVCHPVIESCLEGFALLPPWERCQSSTYRELWAVWFMFSTFAERLRGCLVRVQVDNQAVYYLAIKGKSSVTVLHELLVETLLGALRTGPCPLGPLPCNPSASQQRC